MSHFIPALLAQYSSETLRVLHDTLAADAAKSRRKADTLTARVAELAAELARRETITKEPK